MRHLGALVTAFAHVSTKATARYFGRAITSTAAQDRGCAKMATKDDEFQPFFFAQMADCQLGSLRPSCSDFYHGDHRNHTRPLSLCAL